MKKKLNNQLKSLNVAIVTHVFVSGPALDLEQYLKGKVASLLLIGHPLFFKKRNEINAKEIVSYYKIYKKGNLQKVHQGINWQLPDLFLYLKDAFYTFWWVLIFPKKIDLYIGSDNFSAFIGIILKRLGKVEDVVLYTIDYLPQRFSNPLLNALYHFFDRQCLKYCKIIWNVSDKISLAREEVAGLNRDDYAEQITVPLGIWYKRIPKLSINDKSKYQLVFLGHLLEKQGLDLVIDSLTKISTKIPEIKLLVIGTGSYEKHLKAKVHKKRLEKYVQFTGYIEDHMEIESLLAKSTLAVAMYKPDPSSFTYNADPGKIKNYLSAGLPVILTDVPPIAKDLESKKCGMISAYQVNDFANKVIDLLFHKNKLKQYSLNATLYAKKFDWDVIYNIALGKTIN